jgi:hypothetical protein
MTAFPFRASEHFAPLKSVSRSVAINRFCTVNRRFGHEPDSPEILPSTLISSARSWATWCVSVATVIVAERPDARKFSATEYRISLSPVPDTGSEMISQVALLRAVHWQAGVVRTRNVPAPPAAANVAVVDVSWYAHGAGGGTGGAGVGGGVGAGGGGSGVGGDGGGDALRASCEIVTRSPAIDASAVRATPSLAAILRWITASPFPVDWDGEIQGALTDAVQLQALCVRRSIEMSAPAAGAAVWAAVTVKRQGAGSCATATVLSATLIEPRRVVGSPFGSIR